MDFPPQIPPSGMVLVQRLARQRLWRLPVLFGVCVSLGACQQIADRLSKLMVIPTVSAPAEIGLGTPDTIVEPKVPASSPPVLPAPPMATPSAEVKPLRRPIPKTSYPEKPPSSVARTHKAPKILQDCDSCPSMLALPAGQVEMGSPTDEPGRDDDESPQLRVAVAAFAIGQTEVTQAQWQAFERESGHHTISGCLSRSQDGYLYDAYLAWRNPGFAQSDSHPVVCVNWFDAQAYTQWLSRKTGQSYRLPTESEWEYAARAGTVTSFPWPGGELRLCDYANSADAALARQRPLLRARGCDDSHPFTAPVGSFPPNAWGVYDMHGNVMEWVQDCWSPRLRGNSAQQSPLNCRSRVIRGGGWDLTTQYLRSAYRGKAPQANRGTATGFRVVRAL